MATTNQKLIEQFFQGKGESDLKGLLLKLARNIDDVAATGQGDLLSTNNLSDVANTATALGILGGQPALVSGTNIKTINSASLLGSGNMVVGGLAPTGLDNGATVQDQVLQKGVTVGIASSQAGILNLKNPSDGSIVTVTSGAAKEYKIDNTGHDVAAKLFGTLAISDLTLSASGIDANHVGNLSVINNHASAIVNIGGSTTLAVFNEAAQTATITAAGGTIIPNGVKTGLISDNGTTLTVTATSGLDFQISGGPMTMNGDDTFSGTLADAITGNKNVLNGLIMA